MLKNPFKTFARNLPRSPRTARRTRRRQPRRLAPARCQSLEDRTMLSSGAMDSHSADGLEFDWIRQFGTSLNDSARQVAVDSAGSTYVAGATRGALPGQTSAGDTDAFVRKYDADGNEVWTRQFGTTNRDWAQGLAVDAAGSLYVVGQTQGTLPDQISAGGFDLFLRKYDTDGNEIWTRQFGSSAHDFGEGVAVDKSGSVYVAGNTQGAVPDQTSAGRTDVFIVKYDAAGNDIWTRQFGSSAHDFANSVAVDATGSVYVAGNTLFGALPGQTSHGSRDAFLRKYDENGNELWTDQFGTANQDSANGVAVAGTDVYLVGQTGLLHFLHPGGIPVGGDAYLRKYDTGGNVDWNKQFGTSDADTGRRVAVDQTGIYVGGETFGALPGQISSGSGDAFLRKYDFGGNQIWTEQFGSSERDFLFGIAVDAAGSVRAAGSTVGTLPGQNNEGDFDAYIVKLGAPDTTPPVIESVTVGADLQSFVVQLNDDDLAATSAKDASNYRLTAAGPDGLFDTSDDITLAIDSVAYDAAADLITVRTAEPFFDDRFRLGIDGDDAASDGTPGLTDLAGNHLADGDYTAPFDLRALSLVGDLLNDVENLGLSTGPESSLTGKLDAVLSQMDAGTGNDQSFSAKLESFIRGVEHWYSKGDITLTDRDDLIDDAETILFGLSLT